MYIVIVGSGRLGSTMAKQLSNDNNVVVIDRSEENLERLGFGFNGVKIQGIEFDKENLITAGIEKADLFLALTPDDNVNIMASQMAKELFSVKRIISRVVTFSMKSVYDALGIETVNPVKLAVDVLKNKIYKNTTYLEAIDDDTIICKVPILKNRNFKIQDIEKDYNCIISYILSDSSSKIPTKDDVVGYGDILFCTVSVKDQQKLVEDLAKEM